MELSKAQFNRTVADFCRMAGEKMTVQFFSNTFYAYGSELATLRLLKQYRNTETADAGYSENLKCYYFRLETPLFSGEHSN